MAEHLTRLEDDGLMTPEVGPWGERKYRLVSIHAAMFARSMKWKWHCRVYIDLFAGSGRSRLQGTAQIIAASPVIALTIDDSFDKYIFCEQDPRRLDALRTRVARLALGADVAFVPGNVNDSVQEILSAVPRGSRGFRVLSFCFADPYKIENLRFSTLRQLSARYVDFLVLIPSYMDANRNRARYLEPGNAVLGGFLGTSMWRNAWRSAEKRGARFGDFVADQLGRQMAGLGYGYNGPEDMVMVRSTGKKLPLYHLSFFSRHPLGRRFWTDARRYSTDQLNLFDEKG
jgi:three-Cys-motif partner protein